MKPACIYILFLFFGLIQAPAKAQTADSAQFFTSFDGVKIHYETAGQGRPVVLVHGFLNSAESWKKTPLYTDLQKSGFEVVILDLRGNGQSGKPHNLKAYEDNAEIKDIMGLMAHLGYEKYDIVGYSRGAILTARQITLDPHIRTAVIGGMGTAFTNPEWPRRKMFAEAFSGKAHLYPEAQGAVNYAKTIGADTLALSLQQKAQPSTPKNVLAKIEIPVLVIIGKDDPDQESASDLAQIFNAFVFKTVPGDHDHALREQEFSNEVIRFLKEH